MSSIAVTSMTKKALAARSLASQTPLQKAWHAPGRCAAESHGALPERIDCDVAIIGSGAGAGITAELLAQAPACRCLIIEEGPLKSSSDFRQRESDAYSQLYQEGGGRKTADQAMPVLQGRCVGGSTTVNWAGSFRTPADTLNYWARALRAQRHQLNFASHGNPGSNRWSSASTSAPWLTEAEWQ